MRFALLFETFFAGKQFWNIKRVNPNGRWYKVKPDNIAHLVDEQRVGGQLESLASVGLQTKGAPNTLHTGGRQTTVARHHPRTPMGRIARCAFKRAYDHSLNLLVCNLSWGAPGVVRHKGHPGRCR